MCLKSSLTYLVNMLLLKPSRCLLKWQRRCLLVEIEFLVWRRPQTADRGQRQCKMESDQSANTLEFKSSMHNMLRTTTVVIYELHACILQSKHRWIERTIFKFQLMSGREYNLINNMKKTMTLTRTTEVDETPLSCTQYQQRTSC